MNEIRFNKHVQQICKLFKDKDSRLQELGLNALVEIYQEIGKDLMLVLPKCNLSQHKQIQLEISFKLANENKWSGYLEPVSRQKIGQCKDIYLTLRWDQDLYIIVKKKKH